ncbi:hypothetical protein H920_03512 [Fukomys damarensis]|uniref:Uncharacterized protein n=1 Tax=Fukomys damarensis TaxID=885580 RepID=A0A091DVF8_FUKDA|nr:hypothetical protein H920_03512 [Fukomys damarensis]
MMPWECLRALQVKKPEKTGEWKPEDRSREPLALTKQANKAKQLLSRRAQNPQPLVADRPLPQKSDRQEQDLGTKGVKGLALHSKEEARCPLEGEFSYKPIRDKEGELP